MFEGTGVDVQRARYERPELAWMFFRNFLRHPATVASIVPSSRFLTRCLADIARRDRPRTIVELGPGTGCTTRALLDILPREGRFLAIDVEEEFVVNLRNEPDERLLVHHGRADCLSEALLAHRLTNPDLIVSGIPFSTMPAHEARRILQQVWTSLAPGGRFLAYQVRGHVARYAREWMGAPQVRVEVRNVPPMRIYCWRKPAGPA